MSDPEEKKFPEIRIDLIPSHTRVRGYRGYFSKNFFIFGSDIWHMGFRRVLRGA